MKDWEKRIKEVVESFSWDDAGAYEFDWMPKMKALIQEAREEVWTEATNAITKAMGDGYKALRKNHNETTHIDRSAQ